MKNLRPNIGFVIYSLPEAGNILLTDLVDTLHDLVNRLYVVAWGKGEKLFESRDDAVEVFQVYHASGSNVLTRVWSYVLTQLKISFRLVKLRKRTDIWIFAIGGEGLLLPTITAKMIRKVVLVYPVGSGVDALRRLNDPLVGSLGNLRTINYRLVDGIVLNSHRLIEQFRLEKYRDKVFIAHAHYIHFDKFNVQKPLQQRKSIIGFVGRLSQEKGILNFLEAIPLALNLRDDISFVIIGDGPLRPEVESRIRQHNVSNKVNFIGWVQHDDLPSHLNELKLLVMPSYTEAGPYTVFEAMACGTPTLSTPVGQVPDAITDNKTGFIMENNSPECIARNIVRALSHPNLEQITDLAHDFVRKEVSLESAVNLYRKILQAFTHK